MKCKALKHNQHHGIQTIICLIIEQYSTWPYMECQMIMAGLLDIVGILGQTQKRSLQPALAALDVNAMLKLGEGKAHSWGMLLVVPSLIDAFMMYSILYILQYLSFYRLF